MAVGCNSFGFGCIHFAAAAVVAADAEVEEADVDSIDLASSCFAAGVVAYCNCCNLQ